MLYKKFQLALDSIKEGNFALAKAALDELENHDLNESSKEFHWAINEKIPDTFQAQKESLEVFKLRLLSECDKQQIKPGISIVSGCMNRNSNLIRALKTLPVNEIVIVDWSSKEPVKESIKEIDDERIK